MPPVFIYRLFAGGYGIRPYGYYVVYVLAGEVFLPLILVGISNLMRADIESAPTIFQLCILHSIRTLSALFATMLFGYNDM